EELVVCEFEFEDEDGTELERTADEELLMYELDDVSAWDDELEDGDAAWDDELAAELDRTTEDVTELVEWVLEGATELERIVDEVLLVEWVLEGVTELERIVNEKVLGELACAVELLLDEETCNAELERIAEDDAELERTAELLMCELEACEAELVRLAEVTEELERTAELLMCELEDEARWGRVRSRACLERLAEADAVLERTEEVLMCELEDVRDTELERARLECADDDEEALERAEKLLGSATNANKEWKYGRPTRWKMPRRGKPTLMLKKRAEMPSCCSKTPKPNSCGRCWKMGAKRTGKPSCYQHWKTVCDEAELLLEDAACDDNGDAERRTSRARVGTAGRCVRGRRETELLRTLLEETLCDEPELGRALLEDAACEEDGDTELLRTLPDDVVCDEAELEGEVLEGAACEDDENAELRTLLEDAVCDEAELLRTLLEVAELFACEDDERGADAELLHEAEADDDAKENQISQIMECEADEELRDTDEDCAAECCGELLEWTDDKWAADADDTELLWTLLDRDAEGELLECADRTSERQTQMLKLFEWAAEETDAGEAERLRTLLERDAKRRAAGVGDEEREADADAEDAGLLVCAEEDDGPTRRAGSGRGQSRAGRKGCSNATPRASCWRRPTTNETQRQTQMMRGCSSEPTTSGRTDKDDAELLRTLLPEWADDDEGETDADEAELLRAVLECDAEGELLECADEEEREADTDAELLERETEADDAELLRTLLPEWADDDEGEADADEAELLRTLLERDAGGELLDELLEWADEEERETKAELLERVRDGRRRRRAAVCAARVDRRRRVRERSRWRRAAGELLLGELLEWADEDEREADAEAELLEWADENVREIEADDTELLRTLLEREADEEVLYRRAARLLREAELACDEAAEDAEREDEDDAVCEADVEAETEGRTDNIPRIADGSDAAGANVVTAAARWDTKNAEDVLSGWAAGRRKVGAAESFLRVAVEGRRRGSGPFGT
ncbi:hypothetical protein DFH09DRAFT_1113095, partial [Mycena vulgaris]